MRSRTKERNKKLSDRFRALQAEGLCLADTHRRLAQEFSIEDGYTIALTLRLGLRPSLQKQANPRPTARARPAVYIVLAEEVGLVKIGYSRFADRRFDGLQASSPVRLKNLGYVPHQNAKKLEFVLHQRLAQFRSHTEWYVWNDAVRRILMALPIVAPVRPFSVLAPRPRS